MKANCWEVNLCGREPGGANADVLGVCPAATQRSLDGVHGGKNGGRACWVVAGTLSGRHVHGIFAQRLETCQECNFYKRVREEESASFTMAIVLLGRMKDGEP